MLRLLGPVKTEGTHAPKCRISMSSISIPPVDLAQDPYAAAIGYPSKPPYSFGINRLCFSKPGHLHPVPEPGPLSHSPGAKNVDRNLKIKQSYIFQSPVK